MTVLVWIAEGIFCIAGVVTMLRIWRGPTIMDRLLAIDFLSLIAIGLILLEGRFDDTRMLVAPAVVLALISFIATVAFARLLEGHPKGGEP